MYYLTFGKPVLISGIISIELNIDWTNVSFGLMFIKTNVQNKNSPKISFFYNFKLTWFNLSDISPIDIAL